MSANEDRARGLSLMDGLLTVSRETEARLETYANLLRRWQGAKNLVGPDTMASLWTRHFADSAQVLAAAPRARRWLDLGSGAGFPGLVIAIFLAGQDGAEVHLVESNARKCAFLRAVIRETGAPAHVHASRIGDYVAGTDSVPQILTARALSPLSQLVAMSAPMIARGAVGIFHKGQDVDAELTETSRCWTLDVELIPSRTHPEGFLVMVRDCIRKNA
jgi:16S rRNA (guanine527-N7)-methyltransferase